MNNYKLKIKEMNFLLIKTKKLLKVTLTDFKNLTYFIFLIDIETIGYVNQKLKKLYNIIISVYIIIPSIVVFPVFQIVLNLSPISKTGFQKDIFIKHF